VRWCHCNGRPSVCMCVSFSPCVIHSAWCTHAVSLIAELSFLACLFERSIPLIWGGVQVLWCHVTLNFLTPMRALRRKSRFFAIFCRFERKTLRHQKFSVQVNLLSGYELSNDTKKSPSILDPSPLLGGQKHEKGVHNWFATWDDETLLGSFSDLQLPVSVVRAYVK